MLDYHSEHGVNTKWPFAPTLRTDDNLLDIGAGICRVRCQEDSFPLGRLTTCKDNPGHVILFSDRLGHPGWVRFGSPELALKYIEAGLTQRKEPITA